MSTKTEQPNSEQVPLETIVSLPEDVFNEVVDYIGMVDTDAYIGRSLKERGRKLKKKLIGINKCKVCGKKFKALDEKMKNSRPKGVCVSCFTSNA